MTTKNTGIIIFTEFALFQPSQYIFEIFAVSKIMPKIVILKLFMEYNSKRHFVFVFAILLKSFYSRTFTFLSSKIRNSKN